VKENNKRYSSSHIWFGPYG